MLSDGLRIFTSALMAALGAVAVVRADEPKLDTPVLALPGRVVVKTDGKDVGELSGRTIAVAYRSDGKRLASVTSNKGSGLVKRPYVFKDNSLTTNDLPSASSALKLWDARDGKELRVQIDGFPAGVATFSHDGGQLVMAFSGVRPENKIPSGTVKLWDVASGKELLSLKGHEQQIESLALSSDGKLLAAGGTTTGGTTIKVWDAKTGKDLYTFGGLSGEAMCTAFSSDDKRLAVGTRNFADQVQAGGIRGEVHFWELMTGKNVATWKPHGQYVRTLAYSPDGKQLALGINAPGTGIQKEAAVKVCDAETGRELLSLPDQGEVWRQAQRLVFSSDSRRLAVVLTEQDKTAVKVWDVTTGKLLRSVPVEDAFCCLAFAPDGARLAIGGPQGVTVWEIGR
jgi:WD40 repeat protein